MQHFHFYQKEDLLALTKIRRFETKLGERIKVVFNTDQWEESIEQSSAKYVLIGIPEDIGVKANQGIGGADTTWFPFLSAFLNLQSNDYLIGENLLLLGHFDFRDMEALIKENAFGYEEMIDAYRHAVVQIDAEVEQLIKVVVSKKKIPVVIGGGHNNAYPLIKGSAKGLYQSGVIPLAQINCVNLDAHTDYRPIEGRHSGNPFRYAEEDGYLQKYFAIGIHENYIPQNVLMDFSNNPFFSYITFEDIFIHEKRNFIQAVAHATGFTEETYTGIELDLDCIENTLSSAVTPVGITPTHARQFLHFAATDCKVAYLHICEGATFLSDGRKKDSTGKLISYLVTDFLKSHAMMRS